MASDTQSVEAAIGELQERQNHDGAEHKPRARTVRAHNIMLQEVSHLHVLSGLPAVPVQKAALRWQETELLELCSIRAIWLPVPWRPKEAGRREEVVTSNISYQYEF